MWWNSGFMKRRRWPSHLFFGRWGRNALGCVTGSSFAACDCALAQGLAWNIHEDSIRWASWNFGLVMIARRASCVFFLLQESPWRFHSFRYFWMFLIGCVLFPCQVDHNLFLWYLRLPPAGVSSKDARHSLPALLAFMSPATCFVGPKVFQGDAGCKMFQPDSSQSSSVTQVSQARSSFGLWWLGTIGLHWPYRRFRQYLGAESPDETASQRTLISNMSLHLSM